MPNNNRNPLGRFWVVASRTAVVGVIVLAGLRAALTVTGLGDFAEFAIGALIGLFVILISLAVSLLCVRIFRPFPVNAVATFGAALLALVFLGAFSPAMIAGLLLDPGEWAWPFVWPQGFDALSLFVIVTGGALLAGCVVLVRSGVMVQLAARRRASLLTVTAALLVTSVWIIGSLASDGEDPFVSEYRSLAATLPARIVAPDPSQPGRHDVERLSYGAGENRRRPEFGTQRDLQSRTVDASALLQPWKGLKQRMREWYWGFGLEDAPLNALVWAPRGDARFPLVLIVHGNHGMEEYSDPGYAYLGELLASRGFIAVSVDENYINATWSGDFRGKEMPLRAFLLLEHLRLWRDWNESSNHPFAGRVDMENVALVGHSRGGEALPIAYLYNGLANYPDDATVAFDYGFGIKSLVAIAQVDQRYHRRLQIDDVNFLALQGSYDSDEPAFHGMRQFNRIKLGDDAYRFKTGIYIHGANHGQFNSIWGREDASPPGAWLLNLAPIIPAEDQRQIAKVYIAAFLEATLKDDTRYLRLFQDPRAGAEWLPDHAYVNQFTDSSFIPIATFDEDLDVTTATADGAKITASGFVVWREEELKHRDERLQGTNAVVLGWDENQSPVYEIALAESFWRDGSAAANVLTLSVSGSMEELPKADEDEIKQESNDPEDPVAPRFTIEVADALGRVTSVDTADIVHLAPPLRVQYLKSERLNKERYKSEWEPVLQHVEVPLQRLIADAGGTSVAGIRYIRLRFDRMSRGVVILDDIGVRRPNGN